jgi:uncharacterized OB-fold protein
LRSGPRTRNRGVTRHPSCECDRDSRKGGVMCMAPREIADPQISSETQPFWAEATREQLAIGRCGTCSEAHFYPRTYCPFCHSPDTRLETASGNGRIYSFSIPRAPAPYVIAFVTLSEGPTIMTNIVDCDPATLKIGQAVSVTFRSSLGGQKVPVFAPAG